MEMGELLWKRYGHQINVDFPSPKTDWQWQLTSLGWIGYIPCSLELGISLTPKVKIYNVFRMLEYAYSLDFQFLEGVVECKTLKEFYERLANVLALRVLDRGKKGFYRSYRQEIDNLPFVKGRVDLSRKLQKAWEVNVHCHYEEHTADIEENQILCWTLFRIAQSGICTERVLPIVRRAYHALRGLAGLVPFDPSDCMGRVYNRLNGDYKTLHSICRLFLEHSGPSHEFGDHTTLPFLVNMERLFEKFVAEWLKSHLTSDFNLGVQERVDIGENHSLSFKMDLVLYSTKTGKALCVLDTKYKAKGEPQPADVAQVVTYAEVKKCRLAFLVYPVAVSSPFKESLGEIAVRSTAFSLAGDLEGNGEVFLASLLRGIEDIRT